MTIFLLLSESFFYLIFSLPLFLRNAPANHQRAEGHLLLLTSLASQDAPDGSHSGCSMTSSQLSSFSALRNFFSIPPLISLGVNLLKGHFSFASLWTEEYSGHRQVEVLAFLFMMMQKPFIKYLYLPLIIITVETDNCCVKL